MKKKWIIFSIGILGSILLYCLLLPKSNREIKSRHSELCIKQDYFIPTKIINFDSDIPCINVTIENKTTPVKVDLGSDSAIILPQNFLHELQHKFFIRSEFFYGLRGKKYETNVYSIPSLKIGRLTIFDSKAKELNNKFEKDATLNGENITTINPIGTIGWTLFHNFNFFLDCKNTLLAFCDSLETLKKHGYPIDSFIEIPFSLNRGFIEFEAKSDIGPLRCILDTGCTLNMLNKSIDEISNDHMLFNQIKIEEHAIINPENSDMMSFNPDDECSIQFFKIGNKDFGEVTFSKIKTPLDIDAIVGMEFIESKLLFIDFPHRKFYFSESTPLPIVHQSN